MHKVPSTIEIGDPQMRSFLALVFLCALPAGAAAQTDFSKVEMKATKVAGNVYMLEGAGGNIGVSVGTDGILIVDDQFAPLADKIRAALKGLNQGKLRFILNTHWHGDHTGGNVSFGPEAPIIAHDNVRKRLSSEQRIEFFKSTVPASPKEALPVITFNHSLSVHFNGEEIRAIHYPNGHTDGGNVVGLAKNIGEIITKIPAGAKLIPGHGPLSTIDDLKLYHRMLLETTDAVRKKVAAGKTLDQIKTEGLPEEWKSWGAGFIKTDQWIELIHLSLTRK